MYFVVNQGFDQSSEKGASENRDPGKIRNSFVMRFHTFYLNVIIFIIDHSYKIHFHNFEYWDSNLEIDISRPQIGIPANFHSIRISIVKIVKKNITTKIRNKK